MSSGGRVNGVAGCGGSDGCCLVPPSAGMTGAGGGRTGRGVSRAARGEGRGGRGAGRGLTGLPGSVERGTGEGGGRWALGVRCESYTNRVHCWGGEVKAVAGTGW